MDCVMTRREVPVAAAALILFLICNLSTGGDAQNLSQALALTPPRGWNSYNSFSWIISEQEFLDNAKFVSQNLLKFGYEYVVVDFLWYRKHEPGASVWSAGHDVIDLWGRPIPDPSRWPSSQDGTGFTQVAQKVHALGLKFGIHVMRGISTAAIQANLPILGAKGSPDSATGRPWMAADIVVQGTACSWMSACFVGINSGNEGGQAFVRSLYQQYASWGVDLIKHDCVFGADDLRVDEIELVSQAIEATGRPMAYSISPGVRATPAMGIQVKSLSNMYRVTGDDWDTWSDLQTHFDVARDFAAAGLIGSPNTRGRSWPDLDMLPLGWLTDAGAAYGPHRVCRLSHAEQRMQLSLWAMAKSPLMYGGDLRAIDAATLTLITNSVILDINAHSTNNHEIFRTSSKEIVTSPLDLISCKKDIATKWVLRSAGSPRGEEQVCWTNRSSKRRWRKGGAQPLGCLNWTPVLTNTSSSFPIKYREVDPGSERGSLSTSHPQGGCLVVDVQVLDATLKPSRMTTIAPCNGDSSQVWRLTLDGKVVNERTGLCVQPIAAEGTRVWVASGLAGRVYVAFFNLGLNATTMKVSIDDVMGGLTQTRAATHIKPPSSRASIPSWYYTLSATLNHHLNHLYKAIGSFVNRQIIIVPNTRICQGFDVWTGQDLGKMVDSLTATVESHGATVFSVLCS